eukprot:1336610-Rhodomonas_salina.2
MLREIFHCQNVWCRGETQGNESLSCRLSPARTCTSSGSVMAWSGEPLSLSKFCCAGCCCEGCPTKPGSIALQVAVSTDKPPRTHTAHVWVKRGRV